MTKDSNIRIKDKKHLIAEKHRLEDYEPGATRDEVFQFIDKAITSPKCVKSPAPASK